MEIEKALYMIPVPISRQEWQDVISAGNIDIIKGIRHFIVENVRTARRFLKMFDKNIDISQLTFYELNGHTPEHEIYGYLSALREGEAIGLMSEAGCPGVADPGALVVMKAQSEGLKVIPLVGPSSILMALMASGLNGQKFAFNGYLPVQDNEREKTIRDLELQSRKHDMTQIFIETPYRNEKMFESLVKCLGDQTYLCVATDITNREGEKIMTRKVKDWKKEKISIGKVPTIFLFYSQSSTLPRRR